MNNNNKDLCSLINTIPQYEGTCWFNAILMTSFYSQEMRKLMINKISKTWNKQNKIFKFFKTILKINYNTKDKKIIELFYRNKPEQILINFFNIFEKSLKRFFFKSEYGFFNEYISIFLKKINVNVLDIMYYKNDNKYLLNYFKIYYGFYNDINIDKQQEIEEIKKIIKNIPDVLLVKIIDDDNSNNNNNIYQSDNYNIKFDDFKEEIVFQGYTYKLDSIILSNYNDFLKERHSIAGITCNNNRYIYNGWCRGTNDEGLKIKKEKEKEKLIALPLVKFNWYSINKSFCFTPKINEKINEIKDLCFNFTKGNKLLIYVKNNLNEKSSIIKSNTYSSLSNKKKEFKDFYDINSLTYNQIINILNEKKIIFDINYNIEILRKILYNTIKKENNLLNKNKEYEYFTSLPIKKFKKDELIKIRNNYYLKNNLIGYILISNLNESYLKLTTSGIIKTPNNFKISLNKIKGIIKEIIKVDDFNTLKSLNNYQLALIIKIFGIEYFTNIFNLKHLKTTKEFLLYITNDKNKNKIIKTFNDLKIFKIDENFISKNYIKGDIITITKIEEFIEYLINLTKNVIENIPKKEQIIIKKNTYNVILLYYNNSNFTEKEKKEIINKYETL